MNGQLSAKFPNYDRQNRLKVFLHQASSLDFTPIGIKNLCNRFQVTGSEFDYFVAIEQGLRDNLTKVRQEQEKHEYLREHQDLVTTAIDLEIIEVLNDNKTLQFTGAQVEYFGNRFNVTEQHVLELISIARKNKNLNTDGQKKHQ